MPMIGNEVLVHRQGAEEEIDWQAESARRCWRDQMQDTVQDGHVLVWRDYVDAIPLHSDAIFDLGNLHAGGTLE